MTLFCKPCYPEFIVKKKFEVAYSVDDLREVFASSEADYPHKDRVFQKFVTVFAGVGLVASLALGLTWYAHESGVDFSRDSLQAYASIIDVNGVIETNTAVEVSGNVPEDRIPSESRSMALDVTEQIGATFSGKSFGVIEGLPRGTTLTEMITYDNRHSMTFNNFSNADGDSHVVAAQSTAVTMSAFDSIPDLTDIASTVTPAESGYTVRLEVSFSTDEPRRTLERAVQILARPSLYQSGMTYELAVTIDKLRYEASSASPAAGNAILEEVKLLGSSIVGASQAGFGGNVIETVFTTNGEPGTSQIVTQSDGTNRVDIARSSAAYWQREAQNFGDYPFQVQVLTANGSLAYSN